MAEINIQKKRRPLWPWIVAFLLVIGLVIAFFITYNDGPVLVDKPETNEEEVQNLRDAP